MAIKDGPDLYCAYSILYKVRNTEKSLSDKEFAAFVRAMMVSENGYVIDIGNNEAVNAELALLLDTKWRKHKRLWKKFMAG